MQDPDLRLTAKEGSVPLRQRMRRVEQILVIRSNADQRGQEVRNVGADPGPVAGQRADIQCNPHWFSSTGSPSRHADFRLAEVLDRRILEGMIPCPMECSYRTAGAAVLYGMPSVARTSASSQSR